MNSTTYFCANCGTQQRTNAENQNTEYDEDNNLVASECQNCGNEDVFQGTEEEYQEEHGQEPASFEEELEDMEGIGPARAEEVTEHYEDMEALKEALESGQETDLSTKTEELVREQVELDQENDQSQSAE